MLLIRLCHVIVNVHLKQLIAELKFSTRYKVTICGYDIDTGWHCKDDHYTETID